MDFTEIFCSFTLRHLSSNVCTYITDSKFKKFVLSTDGGIKIKQAHNRLF